jgi:8-amino-7-oxononanoate synthase
MVGEAGAAVELSGRLLEAGFWAPAIRPPTVPRGTSRLRISLCAAHEQADLERLVQALRDARPATRRSGDTVAGGGARL